MYPHDDEDPDEVSGLYAIADAIHRLADVISEVHGGPWPTALAAALRDHGVGIPSDEERND